jgi:hypothetical protein
MDSDDDNSINDDTDNSLCKYGTPLTPYEASKFIENIKFTKFLIV